jgi:hypothetical protein
MSGEHLNPSLIGKISKIGDHEIVHVAEILLGQSDDEEAAQNIRTFLIQFEEMTKATDIACLSALSWTYAAFTDTIKNKRGWEIEISSKEISARVIEVLEDEPGKNMSIDVPEGAIPEGMSREILIEIMRRDFSAMAKIVVRILKKDAVVAEAIFEAALNDLKVSRAQRATAEQLEMTMDDPDAICYPILGIEPADA